MWTKMSEEMGACHAVLTFFKERKEADKRGIKGNLLRYSVGFENINDVIVDFEKAFKKI